MTDDLITEEFKKKVALLHSGQAFFVGQHWFADTVDKLVEEHTYAIREMKAIDLPDGWEVFGRLPGDDHDAWYLVDNRLDGCNPRAHDPVLARPRRQPDVATELATFLSKQRDSATPPLHLAQALLERFDVTPKENK